MPELELPLIFIGASLTTVPRMLVAEQAGPWCGLDCDPDDVNAFDRLTINRASQAAGDASDYLMFGFLPLPFLFDLIDVAVSDPHDGWRGYGRDFLVLLETMTMSLCVNSLVAMIVRRPRPYVYNDDVDDDFRLEGEAAMSFYSGHTSVVFALATAYSRLFMLRHPCSALVVPMWIFTYAAAAAEGALRVVSGSHFLTDTIVGAAAGIGIGLLVPWLHELPDAPDPERPGQLSVQMRPYFAGTSAGLLGSF
jgi:membrane-associated phospholipid phosphatase